MNRNFLFLTILLFISCVFLTHSHAQTLSANLKDLSDKSDVILAGKVSQQKASWNEDHSKIYTRVTINVYESLKGVNVGKSVVVKHPGGEVGEVGELYSHMPTFNNDEEVLLFLKKDKANNEFTVFQGEDGKVTLMTDDKTNEKMTPDRKSFDSVKKQIKKYVQGN